VVAQTASDPLVEPAYVHVRHRMGPPLGDEDVVNVIRRSIESPVTPVDRRLRLVALRLVEPLVVNAHHPRPACGSDGLCVVPLDLPGLVPDAVVVEVACEYGGLVADPVLVHRQG